MKLNNLSKIKEKKKKRKGRGYGSGKGGHTVGYGQKGQKSRSGFKRMKSWIRESKIRSIPKLRGIGKRSTTGKYRKEKVAVINIGDIDKNCKSGDIIDLKYIQGMINTPKSKKTAVKILGHGRINKKITVKGIKMSKSATEKVKKAGGNIL